VRPLRLFLVLTLLVVMAGLASAKPKETKKLLKAIPGVQGVVKAINPDGKTFDMMAGKKKDKAMLTVKFDKMTHFVKMTDDGTAKAQSTDLAAGKMVAVQFDDNDKDFANQVTIIEITGAQ